jgi:hypothetical protein
MQEAQNPRLKSRRLLRESGDSGSQHIQDTWALILFYGVVTIGSLRTWLFFWLISLVGLLWATFLLAQGIWFWVSVWLVLAIVGSNLLVMIMRFS